MIAQGEMCDLEGDRLLVRMCVRRSVCVVVFGVFCLPSGVVTCTACIFFFSYKRCLAFTVQGRAGDSNPWLRPCPT